MRAALLSSRLRQGHIRRPARPHRVAVGLGSVERRFAGFGRAKSSSRFHSAWLAGANGAPSDDFDGRSRPLDGYGDGTAAYDIGAYETPFYSEHVYLPLVLR